LTLLLGRQEQHPACKNSDEVLGAPNHCSYRPDALPDLAGMVICLERGANDLHMVQLMPQPPHHLLLHLNADWFNLSDASIPRLSWKTGC